MIYIYDIECFQNYFCVTFKNVEKQTTITYTIYHSSQNDYKCINELNQLHSFIQINKEKWLVGYNNKYFDNQIINYIYRNFEILSILKTDYLTKEIYDFMSTILNNDNTEYKYKLPFQSVDLMPVGNVQQKSLKLVAVNLNWPLIQDLPIKYDSPITDEDLDTIYKYNLNDVLITEQLYYKLNKDINVRWEVGQKYGIDLMSEPDSGMANRLLEKMYSEASGIPIKDLREMRTNRQIIHYENIVFPEINFQTPVLQELLKNVKSQKWFKSQPFFSKTVIFDGVKYKLGIGGIHSDDKPGIFESNDDQLIYDCDIASMYPRLIVNNNLYPAHLSKLFLTLYENIIKQRLEAKKMGRDTEAYVLKILVNSVFGKTLFEHHWLYDPLVGLRTTVNGQLYLLMLIEQLVLNGHKVISANTDGIVTLIKNNPLAHANYYITCNKWCTNTKFELEYTNYKKYIRRDVNNYITVKDSGCIKEKGDFLQFEELSLKQGIDKPIVSKALYNLFVHNIPIEDTIYDEQSIYSFCTAKKTDSKFVNEFHTLQDGFHNVQELQKTVRYFISTDGGTLFKADRENNKYISYCVNRKVSILNNNQINKDIKDYHIDYGYYITEVKKIVDEIINPQLTLF
jgi:DNA polymerase elongation subunit (family B)